MSRLLPVLALLITTVPAASPARSTTVPAAQNASDDSLRAAVLNPVVVTGTGTYHRADNSPVAVKVISADELRAAQVTSLQDALTRLTTNVTTHTNGMGTFVNFAGVSDDYIVILENGRRVSGDDRWSRFNMANVKRIEIFSGAASALYGSDAIAGVVNIITDDSKNELSATTDTKLLNHGRRSHDITVDVNHGRFSSHTAYSYRHADNWQVNRYQAFDEDGSKVLLLTGRPMSTGFGSDNISQKLEWRIDDQWSVYMRGTYYDYLTNRPRQATYFAQGKKKEGAYTYTTKQAYTYDLHHLSYTYGGGARWTPTNRIHVYLDVYSDNFASKYDYWQTADNVAYDETRKRTHYVDETLRGIFRLSSRNKLSAGIEMVQESLTSESDNIRFETTSTYNVFAQDELQLLHNLEAVAALRFTHNSHFGAALTPNVTLFWHFKGLRLRASYAAGYRTPSLSQLYATDQAKTTARYTLHNTALNPEKNHYVNLNAEYGNRWISVSVSAFLNKIRNMINYRTITQAEIDADATLSALHADGWTTIRQRDNIDKATLRGISAQLKLLLPRGLTLGGGYSFTDSEAETRTLDKQTQAYNVSKSPVDKCVRSVGNVMAAWDYNRHNFGLNISLNGHIQGRRYSSTYGYADAYSQWDFNTRLCWSGLSWSNYKLSPKNARCSIESGLGIENLLNQRDTAPWNANFSTINPGRSLVFSLRISL